MKKRILVGSCGGLTGNYLIRQFKEIGDYYVVGADLTDQICAKFFADEIVCVPAANAPDFVECLIHVLKDKQIDFYFPTHSTEIMIVSKNESTIRAAWKGSCLVCPFETFEKLNNKRTANEALRQFGIPVPQLLSSADRDIIYPVFMKPDTGSGSKQAMKIESNILHREYEKLYPNVSFYQLIEGTEYTVDCMFDAECHLIAYNQRVRLKSMGGAVIVTQNNYEFDILPYLKQLEHAFQFKGCVNFQYILSSGIPYFIDINLRYASGGLPLTVASGIHVPQIMIDIFSNHTTSEVKSCPVNGKTMYRYFNELYEDRSI